ncbi:MAG TPA: hypothetical protein PKV21_07420 [bacterium]|nr:hypothetical protein [bacterium]
MGRRPKPILEDVKLEDLNLKELREIIRNPQKWERVLKETASVIMTKILLKLQQDDLKEYSPKTIAMLLPLLVDIVYSFKAPKLSFSGKNIEEKKQKLKELLENIKQEYPELVEDVKEALGIKDGKNTN